MAVALKKVAIFDVDGTVFRSSLVIDLLEQLIADGVFPPEAREGYQKELTLWLDRKGNYEEYISALVDVFMRYLKGVPYNALKESAERVIAKHKDRTYRYTRDLIADLKKKGYFLLAVSQSPKLALDAFCRQIGFDKVYGRMYELGPQDRFIGTIEDLHIIGNKANVVKRAVEKEGLTLIGSIGVGDTEGDIPMLELVERPICFNPNKTLYTYAKTKGWEIVVERKDVIYKIA